MHPLGEKNGTVFDEYRGGLCNAADGVTPDFLTKSCAVFDAVEPHQIVYIT
jgi:hypothetical protein